jgi:hypothetical protein
MDSQWIIAADLLKKAIQDRAVAEFLENHGTEEVAAAAGDALQVMGDKEQASVIATLAAQLRIKVATQNLAVPKRTYPIADASQLVAQEGDVETMLANTNVKILLGSKSPSESEVVCEYCGGDGYHAVPRTPGLNCEACKGTGKRASA